MYGAIWRLLPGERPVKVLTAAVIILGIVALLWYLLFPWLEPKIRFDHGTVQDDGGTSAPATPGTGGPSRQSPAP